MIAKFSPYPAYRPSGVDMIGELPSHWDLKPLKALAFVWPSNVDKKIEAGEQIVRLCGYTDVYNNDRITADIDFKAGSASLEEVAKFRLRHGDVLLTKDSETANDIGVPALVDYEAPDVVCGYHLAIVRARPAVATGSYLFWAIKSRPLQAQFEFNAQGVTRFGLSVGAIGGVATPAPPLSEQCEIAAFLDCETAKIDALIEKKRRLIELLEEKRKIVLARLVTKGLDQTAPMKFSGADWLGDIPVPWKVIPLKWIASFVGGATPSKDRSDFWAGDIPWASPKDMKVFLIEDTIDHLSPAAIGGSSLSWIPPLSVLIVVRGLILARTVPIAINCRSLTINQDMKAIVCATELNPIFLAYFLRSATQKLLSITEEAGHGTKALRTDLLSAFDICVPPLSEQLSIAAECQRIEQDISMTVVGCEKIIALLQERRRSLIVAAVTGKIDLRNCTVMAADAKPDRFIFRVLVAAEITHRHEGRQRFGRVKLQKILYLAEADAGIHELQGNYYREAAGPLDSGMIADAERGMTSSEFFDAKPQNGSGVTYTQLAKAGRHAPDLAVLLGARLANLRRIIDLLRDLDTRASEAVATIYALWNDALIDGENFDDDRIVQAFLNEWHPEKRQKFKEAEVRHWLDWMKRNSLVPAGRGPRTTSTVPRDMFS